MDRIQERIIEIALQIPEYVGYQAKDRRREEDKLVRRQLAAKYDEQRTRLTRLARQAPLDYIVDLENLDQKLQRLTARLRTAPGGYAGWFDAAQIVESDLDQLTEFDRDLASGVSRLRDALDQLGAAVKSKKNVPNAIGNAADLLDTLNAELDQREQFLALGKKPTPLQAPVRQPSSPLDALQARQAPQSDLAAFGNLRLRDAVSIGNTDYLVAGKMTYSVSTGAFWAFLLQDRGEERWLRIGPGNELSVCSAVDLTVPAPFPEQVEFQGRSLALADSGTANVSVEGAGGVKRGSVNYARYSGENDYRLWIEDYGAQARAMAGQVIDPFEIKTFRR